MSAKRVSLTEFAASQKGPGTPCWMCHVAERAEVEEAVLSAKVTKAAAVRWLRDVCGYSEATANKIDHHFANHVTRPA